MLYLFHGNNRQKIIEKSRGVISALEKKHPDAGVFRMGEETFEENLIDELVGSQGLFKKQYVVLIDSVCADAGKCETLLKKIKEIGLSPNIFILAEGELNKAILSKLSKSADKVQEICLVNEEMAVTKKFEIFSLANALGQRDRKTLWINYLEALRVGASPEKINGVLFWKVKDMLVKGYGRFKREELIDLSSKFVRNYHQARRGQGELEHLLEKLVLSI